MEKIKTYEEFTGSKEITPEKVNAYSEYIKSILPEVKAPQTSDIWPTPKNKK